MKCLVVSPRDQQQQNSEHEEHDDAIELLKLRDVDEHCLDDRQRKKNERRPAYRRDATNESERRERACVRSPNNRKRHLAQPALMIRIGRLFLRERARSEERVRLDGYYKPECNHGRQTDDKRWQSRLDQLSLKAAFIQVDRAEQTSDYSQRRKEVTVENRYESRPRTVRRVP